MPSCPSHIFHTSGDPLSPRRALNGSVWPAAGSPPSSIAIAKATPARLVALRMSLSPALDEPANCGKNAPFRLPARSYRIAAWAEAVPGSCWRRRRSLRGLARGRQAGGAALAHDGAARRLERQIDHRRDVERQQLRGQKPPHDRDAERLAQLGAGPQAERDRKR